LRKDIEDERSAIQHFAIENVFQVTALCGRKLIVENDRVNAGTAALEGELVGFPFANEGGSAGSRHFLQTIPYYLSPGGGGQFRKLRQ
jgi:hypothetical protein